MSVQEGLFVPKVPTQCYAYCTGTCCWDKHFDASEVLPSHPTGQPVCGGIEGGERVNRTTTDKDAVNCKHCIELMFA